MRWLYYVAHPWASPFQGRCKQRSNLLPAGLSFHPQSLTYVSSWGFSPLLPLCNSKYLEYKYPKMKGGGEKTLAGSFVNPTADLERNVLMFAQFRTAVRLQFFQ